MSIGTFSYSIRRMNKIIPSSLSISIFIMMNKKIMVRGKRKDKLKYKFYNSVRDAIIDFEYEDPIYNFGVPYPKKEYKYKKRVANRMRLSYKQHMNGKKKFKVKRRKKRYE